VSQLLKIPEFLVAFIAIVVCLDQIVSFYTLKRKRNSSNTSIPIVDVRPSWKNVVRKAVVDLRSVRTLMATRTRTVTSVRAGDTCEPSVGPDVLERRQRY